MPTRNEHKVDQYRTALAAGDVVTQHELIQFAKHDEDLAAQFIALEDEVFADVPAVAVDADRVRARIRGGQRIQAMLERTEAWVYGAETGIRAFFRYWPRSRLASACFSWGGHLPMLRIAGCSVLPLSAWEVLPSCAHRRFGAGVPRSGMRHRNLWKARKKVDLSGYESLKFA